jgi:hypothetical protein
MCISIPTKENSPKKNRTLSLQARLLAIQISGEKFKFDDDNLECIEMRPSDLDYQTNNL